MFHKPLVHRTIAQTGKQQSLMFRLFCSDLFRELATRGRHSGRLSAPPAAVGTPDRAKLRILRQMTIVPSSKSEESLG